MSALFKVHPLQLLHWFIEPLWKKINGEFYEKKFNMKYSLWLDIPTVNFNKKWQSFERVIFLKAWSAPIGHLIELYTIHFLPYLYLF